MVYFPRMVQATTRVVTFKDRFARVVCRVAFQAHRFAFASILAKNRYLTEYLMIRELWECLSFGGEPTPLISCPLADDLRDGLDRISEFYVMSVRSVGLAQSPFLSCAGTWWTRSTRSWPSWRARSSSRPR